MAFIMTGGTLLPSRSHCWAYVPQRMKSSGKAQIRFSSAMVNLRFSVPLFISVVRPAITAGLGLLLLLYFFGNAPDWTSTSEMQLNDPVRRID